MSASIASKGAFSRHFGFLHHAIKDSVFWCGEKTPTAEPIDEAHRR